MPVTTPTTTVTDGLMMGPLDATKCLPASALPQPCELLARPRQPFAPGSTVRYLRPARFGVDGASSPEPGQAGKPALVTVPYPGRHIVASCFPCARVRPPYVASCPPQCTPVQRCSRGLPLTHTHAHVGCVGNHSNCSPPSSLCLAFASTVLLLGGSISHMAGPPSDIPPSA